LKDEMLKKKNPWPRIEIITNPTFRIIGQRNDLLQSYKMAPNGKLYD